MLLLITIIIIIIIIIYPPPRLVALAASRAPYHHCSCILPLSLTDVQTPWTTGSSNRNTKKSVVKLPVWYIFGKRKGPETDRRNYSKNKPGSGNEIK